MNPIPITLAKHPDLRRMLQTIGYRKREARVIPATSVTLYGTYWSGGSRNTYTAVDLATGKVATAAQFNPPQFGGPAESPTVDIPEGVCIIRHGYFCGEPAMAYIHVHPANMPKLLPNG